MSNPLPISELVRLIGDENIQLQNLGHNMVEGRQMKDHGRITFATSKQHCASLMKQAAGVANADHVGLLLWVPAEIIDRINAERNATQQAEERM